MIKLQDLSVTDREALLQQAREQIEQENLEKNATIMYSLKKKDLLANTLKELEDLLGFKYNIEQKKLKDHVVSIANYLYKVKRNTRKNNNKNAVIISESDWRQYVLVLNNIRVMIIASYKGESLNEPEDKV